MTNDQFGREKNYQLRLLIGGSMLADGIISERDYYVVERRFRDMYRPISTFGAQAHPFMKCSINSLIIIGRN